MKYLVLKRHYRDKCLGSYLAYHKDFDKEKDLFKYLKKETLNSLKELKVFEVSKELEIRTDEEITFDNNETIIFTQTNNIELK